MAEKALMSLRNPHAVRVIEQLQETGSRLAATALPKLAKSARETGRVAAEYAHAKSRDIADRLSDREPSTLARLAGSSGMLSTAGRSVARFAMRRPVLLALGAVAVIGVAAAIGRRARAARQADDAPSGSDQTMGEGSYEGAKDYHRRTQNFLKDKGNASRRASEARDALNSPERSGLERAEQEGLSHARS